MVRRKDDSTGVICGNALEGECHEENGDVTSMSVVMTDMAMATPTSLEGPLNVEPSMMHGLGRCSQ